MAKIKKIYFNGVLTYPMSITDAIIDTDTSKTLTVRLRELEDSIETSSKEIQTIPVTVVTDMINSSSPPST